MKTILSLMSILFLALSPILAGGSSYSSSKYGLWEYKPNTRALGMGGSSIAWPSNATINLQNPAALYGVSMTRYEMNFYFEGNEASTGGIQRYSDRTTINHMAFAIPIGKNFATAINLSRLTAVGYEYSLPSTSAHDGLAYTQRLSGEGGVQQLGFTNAYRINSDWTVGFSVQYIFGTIKRFWELKWSTDQYLNTNDRFEENIHGSRYVGGAIFQKDAFRYGAYYAISSGFGSDNRVVGVYGDTGVAFTKSLQFPNEIGFGATYAIGSKYTVGGDLIYSTWGEASELTTKNRDTWRLSSGVEMQPAQGLNLKWFQKNSYRIGAYYQTLYVGHSGGNYANEYFGTLGIGIPFNKGKNSLDVAFEFGQRGNIATNNVRDRVYRLTFSVTGGEKWFLNRQKRKD